MENRQEYRPRYDNCFLTLVPCVLDHDVILMYVPEVLCHDVEIIRESVFGSARLVLVYTNIMVEENLRWISIVTL